MDNLNLDFVKLIQEKDIDEIFNTVADELIDDFNQITSVKELPGNDNTLDFIVYVSKYTFFIYYFERKGKYEYCAKIKEALTLVLQQSYTLNDMDTTVEGFIAEGINNFREIDKSKNLIK